MVGGESLCGESGEEVSDLGSSADPLIDQGNLYFPSYRLIVLRALPNLKVLDNVEVTPEEVNDAMRASVRREETPVYEEQYQEPVPQRQQQQEYRQPSPVREVCLGRVRKTG